MKCGPGRKKSVDSGSFSAFLSRFIDAHGLKLRPAGPNHTEITLYLNNSDNSLPYTTPGAKGIFSLPMEFVWSRGLGKMSIVQQPRNPWVVVDAYCEQLFGNADLMARLTEARFDVAVVDLIYNECGLALARNLDLPAVGYWAFSFAGGIQLHSVLQSSYRPESG